MTQAIGAGRASRPVCSLRMMSLKVQVQGGRLVLDEPTSMPDGTEVDVAMLGDDDLDPEQRAALHRALDESLEQEARGEVHDLAQVISSLRARR